VVLDEGEDPTPTPPRGRRRRVLVASAVVAIVALVVTVGLLAQRGDEQPPTPQPAAEPSTTPSGVWLSGVSGPGVVTGEVAEWRGRPIEIAGTWSDNNDAMVKLYQLQPGEEYGDWDRPMDLAIGAFGEGESWADAAAGAYDDRWRTSLTNLRDLWAGNPETLYLRFAHEMNGDWYWWSVNEGNAEAFVEAWKRFRGLQQEILPEAELVFCVNRESVGTGMDWREMFPGAEYVDVFGVDYYNQHPYVDTAEEFEASLDDVDGYGAPKGLAKHVEFAYEVGLPMAVPEWSGKASEGDSPAFVEGMYDFFRANGGDGPGELLYEIQFNVPSHDDGVYVFYGEDSRMPESAATYQRLW
jgi:Glycosyl hydrolase family 26